MLSSKIYKTPLVAGLVLLGTMGLSATDDTKKPAPPAKPAATNAKAAPAKPAGPARPGSVKPQAGPSANGASHPSPTTNGAARPGVPAAGRPGLSANTRPQAGGPRETAASQNHGIAGRPMPAGAHVQQLRGGSALQRRADGRISDVHDARRGMDIHHGLNGRQRVIVERADHSRIFAERGRPGYIQRPYMFHGHEFARRSYYYHGRVYESFYRGYRFRGIDIHVYAPVRYYPAGFYGWAYHPWAVPVTYRWGFVGAPWVGYYGFYFTPYPAYANASLWLTDYMISADLAASYEAGKESATLPPNEAQLSAAPVLTPEVKQIIADEVRAEVALENSEAQQNSRNQEIDPASSGISRMLADGHPHLFVVGDDLDVVDASGAECALSQGDALQLRTPPPPDATAVSLVVLASKGGRECANTGMVTVALADLQEMQNHMRETIDRGMAELQKNRGQGGLPVAPPSAAGEPASTSFAAIAPPPDPNDAKEIEQQTNAASQSEQELTAETKQ
jgi:hypothetical protein